MPYVQSVEQMHRTMYMDNVRMVTQQVSNPLVNAVTVVEGRGEAMRAADYLLKKRAVRGEGRSRTNIDNPVNSVARWLVFPESAIESGQYIDKEDKFKMAMDPTSAFMRADVAAVTAAYADTVMGIEEISDDVFQVTGGGILGIAREGKTPGVGTALPAGQLIVNGGTGLTLDKLRAARKLMRKANFGIDGRMDPLFGAITPEQEDNLLGIAASSGTALNTFTIEQLKSGEPTMLLGITWIVTNRLPKTTTIRTCAIWSKANIIVGEWEPVTGMMMNDPHAKNLPHISVSARIDAVRGEDKGVVAIDCVEP